jgi:hypothetical protein
VHHAKARAATQLFEKGSVSISPKRGRLTLSDASQRSSRRQARRGLSSSAETLFFPADRWRERGGWKRHPVFQQQSSHYGQRATCWSRPSRWSVQHYPLSNKCRRSVAGAALRCPVLRARSIILRLLGTTQIVSGRSIQPLGSSAEACHPPLASAASSPRTPHPPVGRPLACERGDQSSKSTPLAGEPSALALWVADHFQDPKSTNNTTTPVTGNPAK